MKLLNAILKAIKHRHSRRPDGPAHLDHNLWQLFLQELELIVERGLVGHTRLHLYICFLFKNTVKICAILYPAMKPKEDLKKKLLKFS
jgi:hypothetical protein